VAATGKDTQTMRRSPQNNSVCPVKDYLHSTGINPLSVSTKQEWRMKTDPQKFRTEVP
jgi:hypothetical protein